MDPFPVPVDCPVCGQARLMVTNRVQELAPDYDEAADMLRLDPILRLHTSYRCPACGCSGDWRGLASSRPRSRA